MKESHSAVCKMVRYRNLPESLLPMKNYLGCERNIEQGLVKMSAFRCACREARMEDMKFLWNLDIELAMYEKQHIIADAQKTGDPYLLALLLILGFPGTEEAKATVPTDPGQASALGRVWRIYEQKGKVRLIFQYYCVIKNLEKKILSALPTEVGFVVQAATGYIKQHNNLPNLLGKKIFSSIENCNLEYVLEFMFKFFGLLKDEEVLFQKVISHYSESKTENEIRKELIQNIVRTFSVNLVILYYHQDLKVIITKTFYANKHRKAECPYFYLVFTGAGFLPVVEDFDIHSTTRPQVELTDLFRLVENPETTPEAFLRSIDEGGFNPNRNQKSRRFSNFTPNRDRMSSSGSQKGSSSGYSINAISIYQPKDSNYQQEMTVFYFACRCGRTDLVSVLLSLDFVNINGVQEKFRRNTPLHVACWRGHVNVVAMLLYLGVDTTIKNSDDELPRLFDASLPHNTQQMLNEMWAAYDSGEFLTKYNNFGIPSVVTPMLTSTNRESTSLIDTILQSSSLIDVNQLCTIIEQNVPLETFKQALHKFPKANINNFSETFRCTPLYCACRNGNPQYVEELLNITGIEFKGPQESYTGEGNTPLHIASWRGHLRVAAALLLRGAIPEPKSGGGKATYPQRETNFNLPYTKRSALRQIIRLSRQDSNKEEILKLAEYHDSNEKMDPQGIARTEPIWFVISGQKEDPPPQYGAMTYLWYKRKANANDKVVLMPLSECSHMNTTFLRYSLNPTQRLWTTKVPVPPLVGLVTNTRQWTYEEWVIDFESMSYTVNDTKYVMWNVVRPPTWYYSSNPNSGGPYVSFSYRANLAISRAVHSGSPAFTFPLSTTYNSSFFSKPSVCLLNFESRECLFTVNGVSNVKNTHKVISEAEYQEKSNWEPDSYLVRGMTKSKDSFFSLVKNSPQYKKVEEAFYLTMPQKDEKGNPINRIVSISTCHNSSRREDWQEQLDRARRLHENDQQFLICVEFTKLLWHGTGSTPPEVIASEGWKVNYSSDKNLWGRGSYFASEASYSAQYGYQDKKTGNYKIFLAEVITGVPFQCLENSNIPEPPANYNSILGWRHGTWVYVVYGLHQVYPSYLVEWSKK